MKTLVILLMMVTPVESGYVVFPSKAIVDCTMKKTPRWDLMKKERVYLERIKDEYKRSKIIARHMDFPQRRILRDVAICCFIIALAAGVVLLWGVLAHSGMYDSYDNETAAAIREQTYQQSIRDAQEHNMQNYYQQQRAQERLLEQSRQMERDYHNNFMRDMREQERYLYDN